MYTLNIGLNNNPFSFIEVVSFFEDLGLTEFEKRLGEYTFNPEPTAVLVLDELPCIETLCKFFTQECIAVVDESTGIGSLVYDTNFRGERYEFDWKYFLRTTKKSIKVN
jgi:hypothetical protein